MVSQGKIASYDEFKYDLGYFEHMEDPEEKAKPVQVQVPAAPEQPQPATKEAPKAAPSA